ncbi:alpha/beta fold hydrolase [Thermotoga profunda]|uniref:alpha/beta fold hydrolase n=1 Tax=Thermotoga profunda TaxID=1508420 RepID=UPI001E458B1E|nr:alpha/beta hydrolase [Thermotoga profunda]
MVNMFKTSDGIMIDYQIYGESEEVIVFLNGIFMHYNNWSFITEQLKDKYKIILHNFRCQWTSGNGMCSFERHVEDLKELLDHLNINKVHLVGTSYGAEVGMFFSVRYPELVRSLTIITATARIVPSIKYKALRWRDGAISKNQEIFVRSWINDVYSEQFLDKYPNLFETIIQRMQLFNYEGVVNLLDAFLELEQKPLLNQLSEIDVPTLVVSAQFDNIKPICFSQEIAQQIPNAKHVCIPNCGHAAIIEKPKEVLFLIKAHLLFLKS